MAERDLVKAALRWIKTQSDCWAFKVAGNPLQRRGIADILGHVAGRFLWAEAKIPGEKLTPSQIAARQEIERSGVEAFTFHTLEEFKEAVDSLRGNPWL